MTADQSGRSAGPCPELPAVPPAVRPIELLAPAGDPEKLRLAVQYGADAVYLGGRDFSLRAYSGNFTPDELREAVAYAHERGVRVYLTLNIFAHPGDLHHLRQAVRDLLAAGPDAVIVADPGVFSLVREEFPTMKIHISTQANVTNEQACRFWHEQGASRIVLARELTLAEIRLIRAGVPDTLELEAFVHGAMCMAYSGRCLLSNFFSGRDSNRGRCTQPCRWQYELTEVKRPELPVTVTGDGRGSYFFSSRDLCMISHIPELLTAGLDSLKIEGRVKSAFYVATVVKAYREAIDRYRTDPAGYITDPAWLADLGKTVHRDFDTGFYFASPQEDAKIFLDDINRREAAVVGIVRAWLPESGLALVEQRNKITAGELLELVQPKGRHRLVTVGGLLDIRQRPIDSTPHPQMLYYLPIPGAENLPAGAFLRRLGDKDRPGAGT